MSLPIAIAFHCHRLFRIRVFPVLCWTCLAFLVSTMEAISFIVQFQHFPVGSAISLSESAASASKSIKSRAINGFRWSYFGINSSIISSSSGIISFFRIRGFHVFHVLRGRFYRNRRSRSCLAFLFRNNHSSESLSSSGIISLFQIRGFCVGIACFMSMESSPSPL